MDRTQIDWQISNEEELVTIFRTQDNITRQLNLLTSKGLVTSEGNNPRYWELTDLGRFILSMYGESPNIDSS